MSVDSTLFEAPARIAIFRALQLGDMLCAVPALRALREAWPQARVTLVGLPNAASFVERFRSYVDELMPFPGVPEFPEQISRHEELPAFYALARAKKFDLAIQMHGSGPIANSIVRKLGASRSAGFVPESVMQETGCYMAWPSELPEPMRYTALMRFIGVPVRSDDLEFPLSDEDIRAAGVLADRLSIEPRRTVILHPGARLPSRRWPLERFAAVGRALAADGWRLAVTGAAEERHLTEPLVAGLTDATVDLTGRTALGPLAALLRACALVVCNDTGISHVAAAVRTPSVVIASGSEVRRWAPLDRDRHIVLSLDVACRPCAYVQCPIGHPCALGVPVEQVVAAARRQLERQGASLASVTE